jgi:EAL domain-containing protein (putative c-di-GMP-specific phosphodiesterase class I)/GGDEF domain-containing protein
LSHPIWPFVAAPAESPNSSGVRSLAHDELVRRYGTLVEQLPLVIYLDALDAASSNIFTSKQIEPMLGYTVEEWASDGDLFVRTLHPEDRDRVLTAHAHTHSTHAPLSLEYRLLARDGRVIFVRDEAVVVQDDTGSPLYLQGYLLDDCVQQTLAQRIQETVRAGDAAARMGGDEFAVVLPSVAEPAEAARAAERLLDRMREPIQVGDEELSVTASIGIAIGSDGEAMLKEADAAMYRAKTQQDVGYAFYDPAVDSAAVQRSRRVAELRSAVERSEFRLDYQPIVALEEHKITTYEALLRWEHPREGLIAPLDFIPLAEESGLIVQIGTWVLEQACAFGAELVAEGREEIRVAVNVSARQLQDRGFAQRVAQCLDVQGLPASHLILELTESVLLAGGDHVQRQLEALKELGVMLALDDFGTGYASLAYLQRFPVDILKIDRTFTAHAVGGAVEPVLLKGIVELGTALGLTLIAEGIETVEQHELVQRLGCHGAQGFYFGYPARVPATNLLVPPVACQEGETLRSRS